jgi:hypothetical protein
MRVMEEGRQQTLAAHISAAAKLDAAQVNAIERLAAQLHPERLLPVVGAGASFDCGMRLAGEIAEDLHQAYRENPDYEPHDETLGENDLADIAEAIFVRTGSQTRVVTELGLPDRALWRPANAMGEHFCGYCVLARMVQEGFFEEAFSFNYDCGAEAGLNASGFGYGEISAGRHWRDRARIVADAATHSSTTKDSSSFTLYKANGCAVRFRELAEVDEEDAAEGIVVRTEQINSWKDSSWSRTTFQNRVENHVVMLIGFSGQDPKFSVELREVFDRVYAQAPPNGSPRVVAIDQAATPTQIEALIKSGLGGLDPDDDVVTRICTGTSTATAALLVLLAEFLRIELDDALAQEEVTLPTELEARLSTLTISAPTMRRWSYLAAGSDDGDLIQRANVIAEDGYVPLNNKPELTARLIAARSRVRNRLGREGAESSNEALADHGFLADVAHGMAYMPIGIDHDVLVASCRPGPELEKLQVTLRGRYPSRLDCVLVSGDGHDLRGVSLLTGREVEVG